MKKFLMDSRGLSVAIPLGLSTEEAGKTDIHIQEAHEVPNKMYQKRLTPREHSSRGGVGSSLNLPAPTGISYWQLHMEQLLLKTTWKQAEQLFHKKR